MQQILVGSSTSGDISPSQVCACNRVHASRGVVDGYGLLHELLADVMEDLVDQVARHNQHDSLGSPGRGSGADSWTVISSAASEICRENGQGKVQSCLLLGHVQQEVGRCKVEGGGGGGGLR